MVWRGTWTSVVENRVKKVNIPTKCGWPYKVIRCPLPLTSCSRIVLAAWGTALWVVQCKRNVVIINCAVVDEVWIAYTDMPSHLVPMAIEVRIECSMPVHVCHVGPRCAAGQCGMLLEVPARGPRQIGNWIARLIGTRTCFPQHIFIGILFRTEGICKYQRYKGENSNYSGKTITSLRSGSAADWHYVCIDCGCHSSCGPGCLPGLHPATYRMNKMRSHSQKKELLTQILQLTKILRPIEGFCLKFEVDIPMTLILM